MVLNEEVTINKNDCFETNDGILCDCGMYTILIRSKQCLSDLPDKFSVRLVKAIDHGLYSGVIKDEQLDLKFLTQLPEFKICAFRGNVIKVLKRNKVFTTGYIVKTKFFSGFLPVKKALKEHKVGDQLYVKIAPTSSGNSIVLTEVLAPPNSIDSSKFRLSNIVGNKAIYVNPPKNEKKVISINKLLQKFNRIPYIIP